MLPGCRIETSNTYDEFYRSGFRSGEIAALIQLSGALADKFHFCPPLRSTVGQAQKVIIRYLESIPERTHENFLDLSIEALQRAWPCRPLSPELRELLRE
jgi:hypothetical protein